MTQIKVLILAWIVSSAAAAAPSLHTCAAFPEITDLAKATPGVHYKVELDLNCNPDTFIGKKNCYDLPVTVYLNYRFNLISTDPDSGFLQKSTVKMSAYAVEISSAEWELLSNEAGYSPKDDLARKQLAELYRKTSESIKLQIRKLIYDGDETCENSFYK